MQLQGSTKSELTVKKQPKINVHWSEGVNRFSEKEEGGEFAEIYGKISPQIHILAPLCAEVFDVAYAYMLRMHICVGFVQTLIHALRCDF